MENCIYGNQIKIVFTFNSLWIVSNDAEETTLSFKIEFKIF